MTRLSSALISLTLATWALDRLPCVVFAATTRALPSGVFGPLLLPPCIRQRSRLFIAGFSQAVPWRVLAKQRWPGHLAPKRVSLPASNSFWRLTKFNILNAPCMGLGVKSLYRGSFQGLTWFNCGPWSAGSTPCPGTLVPPPLSPARRSLVAA